MKRFNIAMTGFGAVGAALAELLLERRDHYRDRHGLDVRLTGVLRARGAAIDAEGLPALPASFGAAPDFPAFLAAARADALVEASPSDIRTGGPALAYIRTALERGLHVIAVSKGALVREGVALRDLAASRGVALAVSGAAAAALPTVDVIRHALAGARVLRIEGILNATTNHLLSAMMTRDISLETALIEAQAAGIAEADPSLDIDGGDTAAKLLIMALFGLDARLSIDDMAVTGIRHVDQAQVRHWRAAGLVPKLIGHARQDDDMWRAGVALQALPGDDPFARVQGSEKAIRVETDDLGTLMVSGGGSAPRATAAAALKDLEHILRERRA